MRKVFFCRLILLITIAMIVLSMSVREQEASAIGVSVEVGEERIALWENDSGEYYVYLPSYADLSDVRFALHTEIPITIDGNTLFDGMLCEEFLLNTPYEFVFYSWGKRQERKITFVQSGDVATLYIDTQTGSMEFIHEKKENEESGKFCLYTENGIVDFTGKLKSINGRGNATWTDREKKAYSLTLEEEANLLGMGKAQKWILLANAFDSSNLRNKIAYDFAKTVGLAYSPDSQWVDLYLNGEYAGLYLLCERNEIHPERVAISKTGSFLVSLELEERLAAQNYAYITTDAKQALRIHDPSNMSEAYMAELEVQWQAVENALLAEDGIDPITGKSWRELIDLDSWARKYLIEELFGSIDACFISQYFYKDGSGKNDIIFAGPVWDFDNSMGNASCWELVAPASFLANHPHNWDSKSAPWFFALYQKDLFYNKVVEVYQSDFLPELNKLLDYGIVNYANQIRQASIMNEIRWFENTTGFAEEVAYISEYMGARMEFFSKIWCENMEYCLVKADYNHDCWYAISPGECLTELHEFEDTDYARFTGWYYSDTNEPFDSTKPITEDIEIYAKWEPIPPNRFKQLAKIAPLVVIAGIGTWILVIEIKRIRKK